MHEFDPLLFVLVLRFERALCCDIGAIFVFAILLLGSVLWAPL